MRTWPRWTATGWVSSRRHPRPTSPPCSWPRSPWVKRSRSAMSAAARGSWHVHEDSMRLAGPLKSDPAVALRRVFVHSSARAEAAANAHALKLQRARGDLERLDRGLGSRHYPNQDKVNARIAVIAKDRRADAYLRTQTGTDPGTGKPTLAWR